MKIAVCSIAYNEEKFVPVWADSAKDADYRFILDTGSTDNTVKKCQEYGVDYYVHKFEPYWRFDVARNMCLSNLPNDIDWVINLDLDEKLCDGWRAIMERELSGSSANRFRYKYIWNWLEDGKPGLTYMGDKIHKRHTHFWKQPVHEVLTPHVEERQHYYYDVLITHHADNNKKRNYMDLLALSVQEDPEDDRNAHYYARELYYFEKYDAAIAEFKRHLGLKRAVWKAERSQSLRFMALSYEGIGDYDNALSTFKACVAEEPTLRESWFHYACYLYRRNLWVELKHAVMMGTSIKNHDNSYMIEDAAWGPLLYEYGALACYNTKDYEESLKYNDMALSIDAKFELSLNNRPFYEAAYHGKQTGNSKGG